MAITLTAEDGTIVANANTYVDVETMTAYASDRGVDLTGGDDSIAAMLIKSMDYLELFRTKWKGAKVSASQVLAWPRENVIIDDGDDYFPTDEIPINLISAQCQVVLAINAGTDVLPNGAPGLPVIREKIGPIETEYAKPVDMASEGWQGSSLPTVDALLAPLLNPSGFGLRTVRV